MAEIHQIFGDFFWKKVILRLIDLYFEVRNMIIEFSTPFIPKNPSIDS